MGIVGVNETSLDDVGHIALAHARAFACVAAARQPMKTPGDKATRRQETGDKRQEAGWTGNSGNWSFNKFPVSCLLSPAFCLLPTVSRLPHNSIS